MFITITGFNVLLKKSTDCGQDNFGTDLLKLKMNIIKFIILLILCINYASSYLDFCMISANV